MGRIYTKKRTGKAEQARLERAFIIRKMLDTRMSQAEVGRILGISRQAVNQILYRHKLTARHAVRDALKRGEIVKPSICENCGETVKLEAHHEDYGEPLTVQWLCSSCHTSLHKKGIKNLDYRIKYREYIEKLATANRLKREKE